MPFDPPPGFTFIPWPSPYIKHLGAELYQRYDGNDRTVATRIGEQQSNLQGFAHGGFLMTLADFALTYGRYEPGMWEPSITLNLSAEFIGPAKRGDWVEARARIFKRSSSLMFGEVHLVVDENVIVRASGVFRPVPAAKA